MNKAWADNEAEAKRRRVDPLSRPGYASYVEGACKRLDAVYYPNAQLWREAVERNGLQIVESEYGYRIDSIVENAGWLDMDFPPDGFIKRVVLTKE